MKLFFRHDICPLDSIKLVHGAFPHYNYVKTIPQQYIDSKY